MDDIDTLTGRDLDAAVARQVLDFVVESCTNTRTHKSEMLRRLGNGAWVVIPYYSTRLSAGLEVGERLHRLGWTVHEASSNRRKDPAGLYHVGLDGPQDQHVSANGPSWEVALARAAPKTVGPMSHQ